MPLVKNTSNFVSYVYY